MELAANAAYERATGKRDLPDEMREPWVADVLPDDAGSDVRDPERFMAGFPKLAARFGRQQFSE